MLTLGLVVLCIAFLLIGFPNLDTPTGLGMVGVAGWTLWQLFFGG